MSNDPPHRRRHSQKKTTKMCNGIIQTYEYCTCDITGATILTDVCSSGYNLANNSCLGAGLSTTYQALDNHPMCPECYAERLHEAHSLFESQYEELEPDHEAAKKQLKKAKRDDKRKEHYFCTAPWTPKLEGDQWESFCRIGEAEGELQWVEEKVQRIEKQRDMEVEDIEKRYGPRTEEQKKVFAEYEAEYGSEEGSEEEKSETSEDEIMEDYNGESEEEY